MIDIDKFELLIHQAELYVAMKSTRENLCWENIIDQIVEGYLGVNHKNAHSLILEYMPHLSYKTILSLWEEIHAPLTYSSLEFHIYALSYIKCRDCTSEISVKVQVDEILYDISKRKEYQEKGGYQG